MKQLLYTLAFLATLSVVPLARANEWTLNAVAPSTNLVSIQENLEWRLMARTTAKKDDCIRFIFVNPYFGDAPETYQSFDMSKPYSMPCAFTSNHEATCTTIDSQTFEIKFDADSTSTKITGTTIEKPFQNPYSARSFQTVQTTFYEGCDMAKPTIEGRTTMSAFQQAVIRKQELSLESSSRKLAVPNAVLTISFKPKSMLPQQGQISLQVPPWYSISEELQPAQYSSDSMLGFTSNSIFESHAGEGFEVLRSNFDASTRSLLIVFSGTRQITADETIVFKISDFKNPVNKDTKKGFRLTTMDSQGFLVNQSEADLRLDTPMNIAGNLVGKEVLMLGDGNGENIGRVFEYNKMSFFMSSYIPFEQFCYFKFVFPDKLKIDDALQIVSGEGIFQPYRSDTSLPNNYWRMDIQANTVYIEGCKIPDFLSSRPFGIITFAYVLLPDYVTDTNPVELYAYSDKAYSKLVFSETKENGGGLMVTKSMLKPGFIRLIEFRPSNYYAFKKDVDYTIIIAPDHDMLPTTRIVITMPATLNFDPRRGCKVTYTKCDCELVPETNELILTNIFDSRTPGGSELKFIISVGDNPIGARYAGDWGARTEGIFEDEEYYIVDGQQDGFSFKALPGFIKSTLDYEATMTFSNDSMMDFTFDTEHDVPADGYFRVTLPVEMANPAEVVDQQKPNLVIGQIVVGATNTTAGRNVDALEFMNLTSEYLLFSLPNGHSTVNNPLILTIEGVRTPRSFKPSTEFVIESMSVEGYIIDAGGSDIQVQMNEMNEMTDLSLYVEDLTNGAVTDYEVTINSFVYLKDKDRVLITTPSQVTFGQDGISCRPAEPDQVGVIGVNCETIDDFSFAVSLTQVDKLEGEFKFIVSGLKNPPNFRTSGKFSNIYMTTGDYFEIQKLSNYDNLFIQTDTPGTIISYTRASSTEVYGLDATYSLDFIPLNPIGKNGMIILDWSESVTFIEQDAVCKVETNQVFTSECTFDFDAKQIKIINVFKNVEDFYQSSVTITLEKITNPESNIGLKPFKLRTYDDTSLDYPIDMLDYLPLTTCNYPCQRCSTDKDYCFKCWDDQPERYLMTTNEFSTCATKCYPGYTTNGNTELHCTQCAAACETCADFGEVGDRQKCVKCAEGYPLRMFDTCVRECPSGTFQDGVTCLACSSKCNTCQGDKDTCTSCELDSALPALLESQCIAECPPGMGNLAGECFDCVFPCKECSTGPQICTECSQENGLALVLGPTCTAECPVGYITNLSEKKCEGCGPGCNNCDENDQRICLECQSDLMLHLDGCVDECPTGYLARDNARECYPLSDLDIKLIPFPCLIIAVVFFFLSYVGSKQKPKHLLIPNWLVLMGFLEHGIILSQIILTYKYGTILYLVLIVIAWVCYLATNIAFVIVHYKQVALKDRTYMNWRNRRAHIWARRLMNWAAIIGSWKAYKLSYSAFWGFKLSPAKFQKPENYRSLQKKFMWVNIISVYALIIICNCVGLYAMQWGTQLYIQMLENILIFMFVIWATMWEQSKQKTLYLADQKYNPLKGGKLNVMSVLDEQDMPEFSKTREHLLNQNDFGKLFVEKKFTELVEVFGNRTCMSFKLERYGLTEDPRAVKTWPASPGAVCNGPIVPLPDPFPDNCYTIGLNEDQMQQMKYLSKGMTTKALQSDAYDADQNLRRDAMLVGHQRDLAEVQQSIEKKKVRGRKNRYFRQIDNEDHEAGVLLDDDEEGRLENQKAKNELLDATASLEVKRQHENKKLVAIETRQRAMQLTEENLRLKKLLEEQRVIDAKDQKEFQDRIIDEEKRRNAILSNIEAARREREAKKNAATSNLAAEKEARLAEIEKMKQGQLAKMGKLTAEERQAAEAQFNAEKARLESEFNEKMLKSQREAAPSEAANSPAKPGPQAQLEQPVKTVRLVPQGLASGKIIADANASDAASLNEAQVIAEKIEVKSASSIAASPIPGNKMNMSMLQTADEASAMDNSFIQDVEFDRRDFNEIDILGSLDRDDKGNVIVPVDDATGAKRSFDKEGRPINHYGYLIDSETGNVIQGGTGATVFQRKDLDERGNIPLPYAIEKFNFNPFDLLGTFFYDDVEDPLSFQKAQRGGRQIDELGRFVSLQGFLVDQDDNIINKNGIKRFDFKQFSQFGGLMPKLYNYYGKAFELQEVMGVFDRDQRGNIQLLLGKDERGTDVYVDKAGFMVNQKGYVVTRDGHICTREGKVLFLKAQLKNGEFPKIFPFTRFNINRVLGDIEMDPGGQPILTKNDIGQTVDRQGRPVNNKGYLCDKHDNVIDIQGKVAFEKPLLEHNGDIPEIFRSNILRSDSQSSLSRFMSEIDRDQRFDESGLMKNQGGAFPRHAAASDTSFESMMEDSPSKYDKQNMRFTHSNPDNIGYGTGMQPKSARWAGTIPDNIMEEISEYEAGYEPEQRKRKRVKGKNYVVEQVTGRDVQMASAYGGVAKPRIRKTGPRFSTVARIDRTGLQTSQGSMRPSQPKIHNLTNARIPFVESNEPSITSNQKRMASSKPTDNAGATTRGDMTTNRTGATGFRAGNPTGWRDQHQEPSVQVESAEDDDAEAAVVSNLRNKRSAAQKKRAKGQGKHRQEMNKNATPNQLQMPKYDRAFEEEFEKVYKKDIDKFIDGSDFEVESLAGFSEISKGTFKSAVQNPRMKGLEKVYLQRLEFQQLGQKTKKYKPKPAVKREFLDRFCDDPKYISKGEMLKFEIGQQTQTGSSGKKKPPGANPYLEPKQQQSQSSLLGQDVGMVQTTAPMMRPAQTPENFKLALQESGHSGQRLVQQQQPSRQNLR